MTNVDTLKQKFLLMGIFLMSCVDAVFTLLWIKLSVGEELNPILSYCLQKGPLLFILTKVFLTFSGVSILFVFRKSKFAKNSASILFFFYYLLTLYHCIGSAIILLESSSF